MALNFEDSLYACLSTYADLLALIGSAANLTWEEALQNAGNDDATPYVVLSLGPDDPQYTMGSIAQLIKQPLTCEIKAPRPESRSALAAVVKTALHNFRGQMGGSEGVYMDRILYDTFHDSYEDNPTRYVRELDFTCWYR